MPQNESGSSGSLDNSGCKRLCISSADESPYELFGTACDLLRVLRSKGMDAMETENWNLMLRRAFEKDDVVSLNIVIRRLQDIIEIPDALQGGPAAAVPSPPGRGSSFRVKFRPCRIR